MAASTTLTLSHGCENDQLYKWVTKLNRPTTSCWNYVKETDVWLTRVMKLHQHSVSLVTRHTPTNPMFGKNRQLVTNEPVEFEKKSVEVHDCRIITGRLRGIYRIYLNLIKESRMMSTCNRLDLPKLGSQPVLPKNLPNHWTNLDLTAQDYQRMASQSGEQQ